MSDSRLMYINRISVAFGDDQSFTCAIARRFGRRAARAVFKRRLRVGGLRAEPADSELLRQTNERKD